MTLFSKIRLSGRYGRVTYVISAIITIAMSALVVSEPVAIPVCVAFKLLSMPVIYYLNSSLTKGIIVSDHMYDAIMDITDDLFLLRDGYTFPIRTREDLIRNGYILR